MVARCHTGDGAMPKLRLLPACCALVLVTLLGSCARSAEARVSRKLLDQVAECNPLSVGPEARCAYITQHEACQPDDGFINYLKIHYCYLDQL